MFASESFIDEIVAALPAMTTVSEIVDAILSTASLLFIEPGLARDEGGGELAGCVMQAGNRLRQRGLEALRG